MAERHARFNEIAKKGEAKLVFLGDSITQGWEGAGRKVWDEVFAPMKAANFGVSGDRTEHVLWRIDNGNFDGLSPELVVIMIGTNNTGHRMDPPEDTASGIAAILDRLKVKVPDAKILLLGIFPRDEKPDGKARVRNREINEAIAKLADGKRVTFLDIGEKFLEPDGTLSREIMPDHLHLSEKGYRIWADAIVDKVRELMKR